MDGEITQPSSKGGMSKTILIIGIILILVILSGAGYMLLGKNTQKPSSSSTTMQPKVSPTPANMFSTIQEALSKSLNLKCDYTENNMHTIAYIKAGAIRADMGLEAASSETKMMKSDEGGSVIYKDKKMYFWNGKKGFMMEFDPSTVMKEIPSVSPSMKKPTEAPAANGQSMMSGLEKFKENCKPGTVDDNLFTPPSDVTFTDMSKLMPSGMKLPSGAPVAPSGMSREQIEEMQKQMIDKYKTSPQGQ